MQQSIEISGKTYEFNQFIGEVVENNKDREVQVYGVGGGGSLNKGKGDIDSVSIGSVSVLHDDIFLIDEDGNECNFRFQGWDVPVRVGHVLHVGWVIRPSGNWDYIIVKNLNLRSEQNNYSIFGGMAYQHNQRFRRIGYVAMIVLAYVVGSWWLLFGGLIANMIFWDMADKKLTKILENEFNQFLIKT